MGTVRRKTGASRPAWAAIAGVAAVVIGLVLASCSASSMSAGPGSSAPASQSGAAPHRGGVVTLDSISTLRSLFNRADGHTRLVLVFSPT